MFYLSLPLLVLRFWFLEAPRGLIVFFASLNNAFMQLFSLPLFIKTYFKPWKNEYRQGLVGFSIAMGIFIKSAFIIVDTLLFLILLIGETLFMTIFFLWPVATVLLLFLK